MAKAATCPRPPRSRRCSTCSGYGARRVAVELNRSVVPKSLHATQALAEGDRVEIIQAIGGG